MRKIPSGGQLVSIIFGGVVATVATLVLVGGAALTWLDNQKGGDGFFQTAAQPFRTDSYAMVTDDLKLSDGNAKVFTDQWVKLRFRVTPTEDKAVFVGVGPTSEVDAYLANSAHAVFSDFETQPFRATFTNQPGDERPDPPTSQRFWTESSTGRGTQSLTWTLEDGSWTVVVMNADGSPGVLTRISAGAAAPELSGLARDANVFGIVMLIVGVACIVVAG